MFVDAIEQVAQYTRPILTIERYYGSTDVLPGAATLFFVNDEGWALTCRHVAELFVASDRLGARHAAFTAERSAPGFDGEPQRLRELEGTYGLSEGVIFELKTRCDNCVVGDYELTLTMHPTLDVALMKFENFEKLGPVSFPVFAADGSALKQGRFLCRLGFPFPEFTNFGYHAESDSIEWTGRGRARTPRFPIEGMVTRHLSGPGGIVGFEISTPGLRGQSGGPAFDPSGRVWGMQSATRHLDLNFDVDMQVIRGGRREQITDSAILHVGNCVHVDVLKAFMREHGVSFLEG